MRPVGGWTARVLAVIAPVLMLAACAGDTASVSSADPLHDLITIDQLAAPDFTVTSAATHVDAATLAAGDSTVASALTRNGLQSAASVEYQRAVDFSTSNGPIDVVATVERFGDVSGASSAYAAMIRQLDAVPGAVPASTGPLGDAAHSTSLVRNTPGGLPAIEITVVWRAGNLVNIIIARGRYGGTRLDDALVLAGLQSQNESGPGSP